MDIIGINADSEEVYIMSVRRVALIIFYDKQGRILLQDRRGISKHGEEWGYFGGAIEQGETPEEAVIRETREELGFYLKKYQYLTDKLVNPFFIGNIKLL